MDRRQFLQSTAVIAAAYQRLFAAQGVPLVGGTVPRWAHALPKLELAGGTIETIAFPTATEELNLAITEFSANILPPDFLPGYSGTPVWGYTNRAVGTLARDTYIGPVIVAKRGTPTRIRFTNNLGVTGGNGLKETFKDWVDRTIHWANPLDSGMGDSGDFPIPVVPHLHGGEIPPELDGGPDSWFTSAGQHGHAYHSFPGAAVQANEAIYKYPNTQEAAPIWFHDHALGLTRLNVYAGLAGGYIITDPTLTLPVGLHAAGLQQGSSGPIEYTIPIVLQDRMFDVKGQLYFPNLGLNLNDHPRWLPEFLGDVMVVNGKAWPYLDVEAKRYRFLLLNGSNARTYELFIVNPEREGAEPSMWQIGTDGGYLDQAVKIDPNAPKGQLQVLRLMPGERADVIIDFRSVAGQTLILRNNARSPYTKGTPPSGPMGQVLQFRVGAAPAMDATYNPAMTPVVRPAGRKIVRLPGTVGGPSVSTGIKARQLTLNEVMGHGGPLEVLVNNTKYHGDGSNRVGFTPVTIGGKTEYYSEVPNEGETEIWEIVNLTADAHPIHFHLVQVQVINRQNFNLRRYTTAYNAAFPGAAYVPAYGPPLNYSTGNPRALGGNPDITPYLQGPASPPPLNEQGWKDTIIMFSGEVTRVAIRYAPTDKPLNAPDLHFPFNPYGRSGHGYVFHCHIIDHEDNEMMRPVQVSAKDGVTRTVTDY